jgi:DNA repair protein RecN (Recombination protein N)
LGSQEAEVQGLFDISDEPDIKARLTEAGLPADDELLIRRVITPSGKHRCYLNGRSASIGMLSSLTAGLANVMSQHEHHSLLDPAEQLKMLDGFAGLDLEVKKMAELFNAVTQTSAQLEKLNEQERDRVQRLDYLSFQLMEIEKTAPNPDEIEEIEREIDRLRHMEMLLKAAKGGSESLYEAEGSVFERLGTVESEIRRAAEHDESLAETARQLGEAAAAVEDAARFLAGYGLKIDSDPQRLSNLEERRDELRRLTRKHGTDLKGVLSLQSQLQKEIETLARYDEVVDGLRSELAARRNEAKRWCEDLSRARVKAARKLTKAILTELADLEFGKADFRVDIETSLEKLGPLGADRVEFLVALNPGEGAHPLRKVASGGELSRLMLAAKRALAGIGPHSTYVFDEVDAGITGSVAASVGRKLQEVAAHHQVICITHLAQISGMADMHFFVSKTANKGRTSTYVRMLDEKERVGELARMLGGEKVTNKTLDAAEELLAGPRAKV